MKRWLALGLFLLGMAVLSPTPALAQSGLGKQSQQLFNGMINVTDPSISMNARRGIITGGGIQIRNQISNIPFFNVQLPRINAGCGGIDAFFGSFTFISSQQLVAALRNIASAALGYAFELALTSMCPSCENIMSKLQAQLNAFNGGQMNTCALGQKLVHAVHADEAIENTFSNVQMQQGLAGVSNWFDTLQAGDSSKSTNSVMADNAPAYALQLLAGNVFWKTAQQTSMVGWFVSGTDYYTASDLMSLTGTIIVCIQGKLGCPDGDASSVQAGQPAPLVRIPKPPLLKAHNFIYGIADITVPIKRYVCDTTDVNGCLNPTEVPINDLVGLKTMIENMMLGSGGSEGIIDAMASGDRPPTAAEQGLMTAGGEYIQLAMALARKRPAAAKQYITSFSDVIAAEFLEQMLTADLDIALTALNKPENRDGQNAETFKEMRQMIQDVERDVLNEVDLAHKKATDKSQVLAYFTQQRDAMQKSNPPVQPVGSN